MAQAGIETKILADRGQVLEKIMSEKLQGWRYAFKEMMKMDSRM